MKVRQARKIMKRAFNITKRESRLLHHKLKFPYWSIKSLHKEHRITKAIRLTSNSLY